MNRQEAKEILMLYRPGTADAEDPVFAEALRLCQSELELKQWFDEHCAVYTTLRARFKTAIPAGLKEQILAERIAHTTPLWRRGPAALAAVAALVIITGVVVLLLQPREATGFETFRNRGAVSTAVLSYRMDLASSDLNQIRAYCRQRKAVADYILPAALEQHATATGCLITSWKGNPVTMICFRSNPQLPRGANDLWFFAIDRTATPGAPADANPVFARVDRSITASWSRDGRTYVLVAEGDEEFLRKFL